MNWTTERPDFACVFVGKGTFQGVDEYSLWEFVWNLGECPDGCDCDGESFHYYLAWTDKDGDEYDDIEECQFDAYLVIAMRPTMEEVHAVETERMLRGYKLEYLSRRVKAKKTPRVRIELEGTRSERKLGTVKKLNERYGENDDQRS